MKRCSVLFLFPIIFSLFLPVGCSKPDQGELIARASVAFAKEHRKSHYDIEGAPSLKEALLNYLQQAEKGSAEADIAVLMKEKPYQEVYYSNLEDSVLQAKRISPASDWRMQTHMRRLALSQLHEKLRGKKVLDVEYAIDKEEASQAVNLIHLRRGITAITSAGRVEIPGTIRTVLSHGGRYVLVHVHQIDED